MAESKWDKYAVPEKKVSKWDKYAVADAPVASTHEDYIDPLDGIEEKGDAEGAAYGGFLEGIPLIGGLLDEAYGLEQSLRNRQDGEPILGETYRANRDFARRQSAEEGRLNPKSKLAGSLVSSIAVPIPGLGKLNGVTGIAKLAGLGATEAATRSNAELTGDETDASGFAKDAALGAGIGGALGAVGNGIGAAASKVDRKAMYEWLKRKSNDWLIGAARLPVGLEKMLRKTGKDQRVADWIYKKSEPGWGDNAENILERLKDREELIDAPHHADVYGRLEGAEEKALRDYVAREAEIAAIKRANIKAGPRERVAAEVVGAAKPRAGSVDADFSAREIPRVKVDGIPVGAKAKAGRQPRAGSVDADFNTTTPNNPFDLYYSPGGLPDAPPVVDLSRGLGDGIPESALATLQEQGLGRIQGELPRGVLPGLPGVESQRIGAGSGIGASNQMPVPGSLDLPPLLDTTRLARNIRNVGGMSKEERMGGEMLARLAEGRARTLEEGTQGVPWTLKQARNYRKGIGNDLQKVFNSPNADVGAKGVQNEIYGQITDAVKNHADELAQKYAPDLVGEARVADENMANNLLAQDMFGRADAAFKRNRELSLTDYLAALGGWSAGPLAAGLAGGANKLFRERGGTTMSKLLRKGAGVLDDGAALGAGGVAEKALQSVRESGVSRLLSGKSATLPTSFVDYLGGGEPPTKEESSDYMLRMNGGQKTNR